MWLRPSVRPSLISKEKRGLKFFIRVDSVFINQSKKPPNHHNFFHKKATLYVQTICKRGYETRGNALYCREENCFSLQTWAGHFYSLCFLNYCQIAWVSQFMMFFGRSYEFQRFYLLKIAFLSEPCKFLKIE